MIQCARNFLLVIVTQAGAGARIVPDFVIPGLRPGSRAFPGQAAQNPESSFVFYTAEKLDSGFAPAERPGMTSLRKFRHD